MGVITYPRSDPRQSILGKGTLAVKFYGVYTGGIQFLID